eukprot:m.166706 g.166706  ORF g.166706 m.166706 type:complete len:522 (-) comp18164_c0_seq1:133-1698(-)
MLSSVGCDAAVDVDVNSTDSSFDWVSRESSKNSSPLPSSEDSFVVVCQTDNDSAAIAVHGSLDMSIKDLGSSHTVALTGIGRNDVEDDDEDEFTFVFGEESAGDVIIPQALQNTSLHSSHRSEPLSFNSEQNDGEENDLTSTLHMASDSIHLASLGQPIEDSDDEHSDSVHDTDDLDDSILLEAESCLCDDDDDDDNIRLPLGCKEIVLERRTTPMSVFDKVGQDPLGFDVNVKNSPNETGVIVTVKSVKDGGLAYTGGLEAGDRIIEINGMKMSDVYYKAQCLELLHDARVTLVVQPHDYENRPQNATLQQLPSVVVADASAMGPLIVHRKSTSDEHEEKVTVPFGGVACGASLPQYYAAIALQIPDPFDYEVTTKLRTTTWADTVFEQDVILNRIAVAAALAEKPEDISLGFELSLTEIADGGLVAVVCSVALGSMAAAALGGDGMHVGDRILAVNGTSLAELPLGSAGRIYLFRLLSAKVVQLRVCIQRLVKGYEDVRTGTFTPDNAAFLAYDGHTKT